MYDFATAITAAVVGFIQDMLDLVDPTTFVGGAVAIAILGTLGIRFVGRLVRLARG